MSILLKEIVPPSTSSEPEPTSAEIQKAADKVIEIFTTIRTRCHELEASPEDKKGLIAFFEEIGWVLHRHGIIK